MIQLNKNGQLIGKRITAYTIDMFLSSLIYIGMFLLILPLSMYVSKEDILTFINRIDPTVAYYVLLLLYFTIQEFFWHKTIGKKILKLKIVHTDESRLRGYQLILRNIFRVIDIITIIGFVIVLFDSKNRRLGDTISKTMVVEERKRTRDCS